ncbi:MAG: DUF2892 domain-containing protein [Gammaproteobacteria bacterium]|nr:DUF2892 domain-containing protein [Gammaproteobacteria bacterium]
MKPNVGTVDRLIRGLVGIVAIVSWPLNLIEGNLGIVVVAVGVVMLGTALFRWCPPYALFGINTGARED